MEWPQCRSGITDIQNGDLKNVSNWSNWREWPNGNE